MCMIETNQIKNLVYFHQSVSAFWTVNKVQHLIWTFFDKYFTIRVHHLYLETNLSDNTPIFETFPPFWVCNRNLLHRISHVIFRPWYKYEFCNTWNLEITVHSVLVPARVGASELLSWIYLLPPANKVCEGYVFTPVCHSVHRGDVCPSACWDTHPPTRGRYRHPPNDQRQTPPGTRGRHPLLRSACWGIQPTSGRYASYWNAYLLYGWFLVN